MKYLPLFFKALLLEAGLEADQLGFELAYQYVCQDCEGQLNMLHHKTGLLNLVNLFLEKHLRKLLGKLNFSALIWYFLRWQKYCFKQGIFLFLEEYYLFKHFQYVLLLSEINNKIHINDQKYLRTQLKTSRNNLNILRQYFT